METTGHHARRRAVPEWLVAALAGGLGALARVAVVEAARHPVPALLAVNVGGCAVLGLLEAGRGPTGGARRWLTASLGGWTTWSGVAVLAARGGPGGVALLVASLLAGPLALAGVRRTAAGRRAL